MKLFCLLLKIWVYPYYRNNTGFFLFFFFLFFGTVSPGALVSYHLSLIQSMLSSYTILAGVLIIWLCYAYKCALFFYSSFKKAEGQFLYQLQTLSFRKQIILLSLMEAALFLPILAYIGVIVLIGAQNGQVLQASILIQFVFAICLGSALYYSKLINKTWLSNKPIFSFNFFQSSKPKSFFFLLLHFSFQKKKKQILVLKLLSIIIFYIALVWNGDRYDHDSLVLFLLVIILSHAVLAFQFVQFMEKTLLLLRNLPLRSIYIFLAYHFTFAFLFLPELVYLLPVGYSLVGVQQIFAIYFTLVNTLLLFTTVQYSGSIDRNEFMKILFGVGFVSIFFFNSEQYTWWAILSCIISAFLFFTSYSQYEPRLET